MKYPPFTIFQKELKWSQRTLQADKVGVEAPETFILASNCVRESTVAINCFRADFADKASKKGIRARNKLEFRNQSKSGHTGA